ncbi:MAG: transcription-repair coupling factor [Proteobacteria bacterium]|nr:transcription-repair coupling factor [Pseudomonadota bacterium]
MEPRSQFTQIAAGRPLTISGVADGAEGLVLADLTRFLAARRPEAAPGTSVVVVCRDGQRMAQLSRAFAFFAPEIAVMEFPAWDCQPYDRASPHAAIMAQRMTVLSRLARSNGRERARVVLTTVNSVLQRLPARALVAVLALSAAPGNMLAMDTVVAWLDLNGFMRSSTVREPGEYAVRGGIIDLFAAGSAQPLRLDFFGNTLESIRSFDAQTQRTSDQLRAVDLIPAAEFQLTAQSISRFRTGYVAAFGAPAADDQLYAAVSQGRRHVGMEHWLPLFHDELDTLFDYATDAAIALEPLAEDAMRERCAQIADYFTARQDALRAADTGVAYKPLPPERLYLADKQWREHLERRAVIRIMPFAVPEGGVTVTVTDAATRPGRNFAPERALPDANVFEAVKTHIDALHSGGKRVVVALWSEGSRERMAHVLADHGVGNVASVASWSQAMGLARGQVALATLGLESGFESAHAAMIAEQDILGDRLVRPRRASRRAENFITEITSLTVGDIVVHVDHGIGRFVGLRTIEAAGAPHDCVELHYAGKDRLFLPVENIELLSRYGSEEATVELDRLGGGAWQARKARMKERIREIASELIRTAAARQLHEAPRLAAGPGAYDEFGAGFPYDETDDQRAAIEAVLDDLSTGRPMDRLICGDVGFGKTEVALRAAFACVMNGKQVAVTVPTTLLARQHFKTFGERFRGFPVNVAQMSRLVAKGDAAKVREGLANGQVDIVIGTHALLGKAVKFKDLGLLVVDEEQHFGVAHKEKLKALRADVHVLTLTATPIPRTLQLALSGVRELSIIASPPVDRLVVRTFVSPFDPLIVREALLRERFRGGQAFYVCPRIEDLAEAKAFLDRTVPEVNVAVAHGQMQSAVLEDIMSAFYDGKFDVLLSTTIVESGLDIPNANTLIVHRADMFGLAQLYQLRGRVGRAKSRAYALFTLPTNRKITAQAERRLKVLQSLDSLGAGFQLASHDLDLRGAGNLLGEEQSGHIKEVGYELYQQMLEEAVLSLKAGVTAPASERWSPQITIGAPVLIPEDYVADLGVRLGLYRRLADLNDEREIDSFAAELADRFGKLPDEVGHLLEIVGIKNLCRRSNVEKLDVGPKGVVLAFRDGKFNDPEALVAFIHAQAPQARVRPDMKVVFMADWETPAQRLGGVARLLRRIVALAEHAKAA